MENSKTLKKLKVFKIAKIFVLFLAICTVVILLVRYAVPVILNTFWGRDIALVDDSSMQLLEINLPQSENSFYDLDKLKDVINIANVPEGKNLAKDFVSSDSWGDGKVNLLLNDNKLALQYFNDAAGKQKFQSPATADPNKISQDVIAMNSWRQAAQLSCVNAIQLAKNGHGDGAIREAMKVMLVGDLIEKSQSNLITYLVGVALKSNAIDTLQKILSISNIDQQTRLKYKKMLTEYTLSDNDSMWKIEYLTRKQTILEIASGKYDLSNTSIPEDISIKTNYYFKPNLSIKENFSYFSNFIDRAKTPCALDDVNFNREGLIMKAGFKWYFTENAVNKILLSTSDIAYQGFLANKCKIREKYEKLISDF